MMLIDDFLDDQHAQSEPGPFGLEQGLEDFCLDLIRHADAVIGDANHSILSNYNMVIQV
jgi:hypothetical protein